MDTFDLGNTLLENAPVEASRLVKAISVLDFLQMKFPPRENILDPWLPSQGLAMIYAMRGVGKTYFSLSLAVMVASGGSMHTWKSQRPRGVLYLDGEMPAVVMQERLARTIQMSVSD